MPNLIVSRVFASRGFLAKHTVVLDGKPIGVLKNGQTLTVPIAPGSHTLLLDPKSMMIEKFAPITIKVGTSDVQVVLDPGSTQWRFTITGSDNGGSIADRMRPTFGEILQNVLNDMQRHATCSVFFHDKYALIRPIGYKCYYSGGTSLETFEQGDAAAAFATYIHESPQGAYLDPHIGGRGVDIYRR